MRPFERVLSSRIPQIVVARLARVPSFGVLATFGRQLLLLSTGYAKSRSSKSMNDINTAAAPYTSEYAKADSK